MKALPWIRFSWDLAVLPAEFSDLPEHYQVAPATDDEEKQLREVITRALTLDPAWNPSLQETLQTMNRWMDFAAENPEPSVRLALHHGARIIGASVLSLDPNAPSQLAPGPCISMEYRNRGFGAHLLEHSLATLRAAGLTRAHAVTRAPSPVARFLYPKFHGASAPYEIRPALAA